MTAPPATYPYPQPPPPAPQAKRPTPMPARIAGVFGIWFFGAIVGAATAASNSGGGAGQAPAVTVTVPGAPETQVVTAAPAADSSTVPARTAAAAAGFDGDGTYAVPDDVKPGTYRAGRPDESCYWARMKDASGGVDAIIANGNSAGPVTLTIRKTDGAIEVQGCARFVRVK